jgi:hypothetical protein
MPSTPIAEIESSYGPSGPNNKKAPTDSIGPKCGTVPKPTIQKSKTDSYWGNLIEDNIILLGFLLVFFKFLPNITRMLPLGKYTELAFIFHALVLFISIKFVIPML